VYDRRKSVLAEEQMGWEFADRAHQPATAAFRLRPASNCIETDITSRAPSGQKCAGSAGDVDMTTSSQRHKAGITQAVPAEQ
jgi:hypothetical protein